MHIRNSRQRWGAVAQLLHWVMALLVFGMMILGWVMVYWPMGPTQFELYALHKSFGLTVLGLAVLRLVWRSLNPTPQLPDNMSNWERRAANSAHVLLYVILFAMPVSGYLINAGAGFPLTYFGWLSVPNLVAESERLETVAGWIHLSLFWLLALVLIGHIGGALRHHFVKRDDVMRRMLPGRRESRN